MRHPHKYEQMLPEEFYAELERAPIAYWGCGAMEEHGLQSALGTDAGIAYETCLRAAAITGGIVFPLVPFAPAGIPGFSRKQLRSGREQLYYPSLWVSRELCRDLYLELMESMADLGFRACVGFGGHWPADLLLQEITRDKDGSIGDMRFWGGGTVTLLRDLLDEEAKREPHITDHGMFWETSVLAALGSDLVDAPRALRIKEHSLPSQLKGQPQEALARVVAADPEYGERWLSVATERLAGRARQLLDAAAR